MTYTDDLNFVEGGFESAPAYPVVFGVSMTPKVIGILVGITGIGAAVFMGLNLVMPTWETFQQLEQKRTDLQGQIDQKKASINQIDIVKKELAQAKQQQAQVLSVFANEKTLDTLLIDLNRLIEAGNAQVPVNGVRSKLKKFTPAAQKTEPVNDGSLGAGVNGKLKRSVVGVEFIGTYEQTQSILRNIERLQPLLLVKEYKSILAPEPPPLEGEPRRIGPPPITTSFQLQALMPMNPEEVAAAAKAVEPAKQ
jgi:type IV pilus assembly protein PilO